MKTFDKSMLFEGIRERHLGTERRRLVEKWTRTGLLRGLDGQRREDMAQLLENQAAQILRESGNALSTGGGSLTSSGQVQGFATIAFPIVRRVFGGLVANEIVSVQPMSLPSGLIFYLDYTYGSNQGGDAGFSLSSTSVQNTYASGQSLYANPTGKGIQSGSLAAGGMYDLVGSGYTKIHTQSQALSASNDNIGAFTGASNAWKVGGTVAASTDFSSSNARFVAFDPQVEADLLSNTLDYCYVHVPVSTFTTNIANGDLEAVDQIALFGFGAGNGGNTPTTGWGSTYQGGTNVLNLRRHNKRGTWTGTVFTPDPFNGDHIQFVVRLTNVGLVPSGTANFKVTASMALIDKLSVDGTSGATLTIPTFETDFSTPSPTIPEIDIKIESLAITAESRKLRARWSPELAQDLNAYHSMDAEVELTQILSQQVALEIDREVLLDLLTQANGANLYWSRAPGKFVNKLTGDPISLASSLSPGPAFTGTVREWYETLVETIIDVANTIHRKTLRGAANFVVCGPDVATILEASTLYRSKIAIDGDGQAASVFSIGAEPIGTLTNRFTVYKDPYFPRSKVLVGFKGGSYLETGYVYAPYVPLIVTQTIYAPDDFSPRRGVMTRYGKRVVRSDFYGTVTLLDMSII